MSFASFQMNRACAKSDAKRDAGKTIPADIEYLRDIAYGEDPKFNILDICYPKDSADKKLPVIFSIHGGGYVYGTKEVYQFYCAFLAKNGFCVINFNYRLAPKYKFPTPLSDMSSVADFIIENKDKYPVDLNNVFIVGDSAGAQLTSQYAAIISNDEYAAIMGIKKPEMNVRAIGLACGMYNLYDMAMHQNRGIARDYLTSKPQVFGDKLKVLDYITENYPPTYIFSSGGDFLKTECNPMAELLKSRNVECESMIYGDENTGHVFHVNVGTEIADKTNMDQVEFFKRHIV